jgi:hypothetical protein
MKTVLSFLMLFLLSSFTNEFQENSFIYKDQNQTIKLELETNQKFLVLNQPTEIKISVENIDLRHSSIIGKGICLTGESGKNFFTVTTTVDEEDVINNHYPISFNYSIGRNKKLKSHKFLIPVKK